LSQLTEKQASIGLIYIARGGPGGAESVRQFCESYLARDAGIVHSLYVAAKRWRSDDEIRRLEMYFAGFPINIVSLPDDGLDIGAYMRIARRIPAEWLCFLNTHSRILKENWLSLLYHAAQGSEVGATGATGSWESAFNALLDAQWPTQFGSRVRRAAALARNWAQFPAFPNPHLRTNAFLTRSALFSEFASQVAFPRTKRDVYAIESGSRSYSSFLRRRGLDLRVCGADGVAYSIDSWPGSGTYRSRNQDNLLVADNQTQEFSAADPVLRESLRVSAWGVLPD
jgi:hypothetical protein